LVGTDKKQKQGLETVIIRKKFAKSRNSPGTPQKKSRCGIGGTSRLANVRQKESGRKKKRGTPHRWKQP